MLSGKVLIFVIVINGSDAVCVLADRCGVVGLVFRSDDGMEGWRFFINRLNGGCHCLIRARMSKASHAQQAKEKEKKKANSGFHLKA